MRIAPGKAVRWSKQEKADLLSRAAVAVVDEGLVASSSRILRKIQTQVLPPERQRAIKGPTSSPWFVAALGEAVAALKAQRAAAEGHAAAAVQTGDAEPAVEQAVAEPVTPQSPAGDRLNVALLDLYEALQHEVRDAAVKLVEELLADRIGTAIPEVVRAARAVKETPKPSVVVVVLKGGQVTEIRREFEAALNIRFIGGSENAHQLRVLCDTSDVAVAMIDFLGHSSTAIMTSRAKRYLPVSGGLTRLRETLRGLNPGH